MTGQMRKVYGFIGILALCLLTGCGAGGNGAGSRSVSSDGRNAQEEIASDTRDIFAMDTYMTLTAYGDRAGEALDAAVKEIERLDALLSAEKQDSEIYIVNHQGSEILSEDTAVLVQKSLELYQDTDGAFDITVYPLMVEWGFTTEKYNVPDRSSLKELLQWVDASKLEYDSEKKLLSLPEHVQIDLGGIAKGYASGRVMEIFREYDIVSGIVSLGGNVQLYGAKTDGSLWKVGIQDPENTSGSIGVLQAEGKAVITSGGYERYFEEDGVVWHHILDPATGYSADSGLISVSIVSEDGMLADGLSTALFIMGKDKALEYWREHAGEFDVILVEEDGSVTVSEGLQDSFTADRGFEVAEQ